MTRIDPFEVFSEEDLRAILTAAREASGGSIGADHARRVIAWAIEREAQGVSVAAMIAALDVAGAERAGAHA